VKFFTILKGTSTRIPNKNFINVGGVPLWFYSLSDLLEQDLTINVDSGALKRLEGLNLPSNWTVIPREFRHEIWEEERSDSPVLDMLFGFCKSLEDPASVVCLTHVTSPFVQLETFTHAELALSDGFRSVQSVTKIQDFAWLRNGSLDSPVNFDPKIVLKTQDLPPLLISNGAFFVAKAGDILSQSSRVPAPNFMYELSPTESIEIDHHGDLELAQRVALALPDKVDIWNSLT